MLNKLKNKNVLFGIAVFIFMVILGVLLFFINSKKIDKMWKTDNITIMLADGSSFDVDSKETVGRISRLCNDGIFRTVTEDKKLQGNCEIWVDFNNGTIVGMFLNRDYGYVGDSKQYIGDPVFLPNGLNEFIRNLIKESINYETVDGEIIENKDLGYLLKLDEASIEKLDCEEVFVSYENLPFSEIKKLDFAVGDTIKAYYTGEILESFPPMIRCSKLELVESKDAKSQKEVTPVIKDEDLNEGYESKLLESKPVLPTETPDNGLKFELIELTSDAISDKIPNWVLGETNLNPLYSINNADFLIDTLAYDKFKDFYSANWTKEQVDQIYLGQGIKCFDLDSSTNSVYYPALLNGNVVALFQVKDNGGGNYSYSLTYELINVLNEISLFSSEDMPLILIKSDGTLCGMIENTVYGQSDVDIDKLNLSEISGEIVVNVFEKLVINDVSEEGQTEETLEDATTIDESVSNDSDIVVRNRDLSPVDDNDDDESNDIVVLQ